MLQTQDCDLHFLGGILSVDKKIPRPDLVAKRLISAYGSVAEVLCAPSEDIVRLSGMTEMSALIVKSSYTAIIASVFTRLKTAPSLDYDALIAMVLWTIGRSPVEKVQLFYLDANHRFIGEEIICSGSSSFVSVDVNTIIASVCRKNAKSFMIAHNHPSGSLLPSDHDLRLIDKLLRVTALMEIELLESLIVSGYDWYSFKQAGHL